MLNIRYSYYRLTTILVTNLVNDPVYNLVYSLVYVYLPKSLIAYRFFYI